LIIANLFQSLKVSPEIDENLIRHLVLNTYRMYRSKFHSEYGELVICNDSGKYWRKDIFPQYKYNRSKNKKKDNIDWSKVHEIMNTIHHEVLETFPYKNIKILSVEADDIIAVLCKKYSEKEKIVIVSNDKDFNQLQRYPNVRQYSPIKKEFINCGDPEDFLISHIIKGDSSDGIPNILSDDDTFLCEDKRQKPCGMKKINQIKGELSEWTNTDNWKRNQKLIDFNFIPVKIEEDILDEYEKEVKGKRKDILNYLIENKLKELTKTLEDF
jgi:hypothetical protein